MTHVLLPLKEIKSWVESLDMQELDLNEQIYAKDYMIEAINKFVISLDEKDIEEKALEKYPVVADYLGMSGDRTKQYGKDFNERYRNAYKQALTDLLQ